MSAKAGYAPWLIASLSFVLGIAVATIVPPLLSVPRVRQIEAGYNLDSPGASYEADCRESEWDCQESAKRYCDASGRDFGRIPSREAQRIAFNCLKRVKPPPTLEEEKKGIESACRSGKLAGKVIIPSDGRFFVGTEEQARKTTTGSFSTCDQILNGIWPP